MIGEVLSSYVIERRLGQGGMGEVYLAAHRRIARRVAIKLLLPEMSRDAKVVERLFTEAQATSLIDHPNIVQVVDCDIHSSGRAYIVMEYLRGESLASAMGRVGDLRDDLGAVLSIGAQIADALAAAHAKGIIHRDLKPDNVFLLKGVPPAPTVVVKVLDFGIAKLAAGNVFSAAKTRTGSLLGTPLYMSPEQCRSAPNIDHRSDIYSLGCVLYQMLTGRPPFPHEAFGELILAHVNEAPQPLDAHGVRAPAALEALVMRMLAKAPDQRPESMSSVAAELRQIGQSTGAGPRLVVEQPPELPATLGAPARGEGPQPMAGGTAVLDEAWPPQAAARTPAEETRPFPNSASTTLRRGAGEHIQGPAPRPAARMGPVIALGLTLAAGAAAWVFWPRPAPLPRVAPAASPAASNDVTTPAVAPETPPVAAKTAPNPQPTVVVEVANPPTGLSVQMDGRPASLPLRLARDGHEHLLAFSAPGFRDETRSIEATGDVKISLALDKLPEPTKTVTPRERRRHVDGKRPPEASKRPSAITDL